MAKLVHWLYGFRPAAQAWEEHYSEKLENAGFIRGDATPVAFTHKARDISCVVHGDDFTFLGYGKDLRLMQERMEEWYELERRKGCWENTPPT